MAKDFARFADIYNLANTYYVSGQSKIETVDRLRTIVLRVRKQWDYCCHVSLHGAISRSLRVPMIIVFTSSCVTQEARTIIFETTMLLKFALTCL